MSIKKAEFIRYFREKLQNIDVDSNIHDTLILLIQSAEDHFYKNGKKLGNIKREAVMETIKILMKKPLESNQLIGMIDSIVLNSDIKRTPLYMRFYRLCKAYFQKSAQK